MIWAQCRLWVDLRLGAAATSPAMSAMPPKATKFLQHGKCRDGPCSDMGLALLDHLVSAAAQRQGHRQAERLGGLEVDDHFNLGCLLDRQAGEQDQA